MVFFSQIFRTVELMEYYLSILKFRDIFYILLKDLFDKELFKYLIIFTAGDIYAFNVLGSKLQYLLRNLTENNVSWCPTRPDLCLSQPDLLSR